MVFGRSLAQWGLLGVQNSVLYYRFCDGNLLPTGARLRSREIARASTEDDFYVQVRTGYDMAFLSDAAGIKEAPQPATRRQRLAFYGGDTTHADAMRKSVWRAILRFADRGLVLMGATDEYWMGKSPPHFHVLRANSLTGIYVIPQINVRVSAPNERLWQMDDGTVIMTSMMWTNFFRLTLLHVPSPFVMDHSVLEEFPETFA